jgi:hypothetical protein
VGFPLGAAWMPPRPGVLAVESFEAVEHQCPPVARREAGRFGRLAQPLALIQGRAHGGGDVGSQARNADAGR